GEYITFPAAKFFQPLEFVTSHKIGIVPSTVATNKCIAFFNGEVTKSSQRTAKIHATVRSVKSGEICSVRNSQGTFSAKHAIVFNNNQVRLNATDSFPYPIVVT